MQLHSLQIKGFRQFVDTTVYFSDATFIIGQNNTGKSSILKALECLLTASDKIAEDDCLQSPDSNSQKQFYSETVELIAEFRNLPIEAKQWRGFKGRVIEELTAEGHPDYRIYYRKVFNRKTGKCDKYLLEHPRTLKANYEGYKKPNDLIQAGLPKEALGDVLDESKYGTNLKDDDLQMIDELWEYETERKMWVLNPGGFQQNILARLPTFLLIPAQDKIAEIGETKGTLSNILQELFASVRDNSDHYKEAKRHLELLEQEFDPKDSQSELGEMMYGLNKVLGDVFPSTQINAGASLKDADKVLNPEFRITMQSNIETPVSHQGTGLIRAAVFALLRYKAQRDKRIKNLERGLIIGFEEPEIYLHPQAATQMREVIYELALAPGNQIVCTTHSPYMIDLGKKPNQVLNYCSRIIHEAIPNIETIEVKPFNVTEAFTRITEDDRDHVKMLVKIDDYVAKVFFARKILIVEGDTEEVVLRQTIAILSEEDRKRIIGEWQIIKARGKATIIPLIKYLKALGMLPHVMHDRDTVEGATKFNKPIENALNNSGALFLLSNCIEDTLNYPAPKYDKPYTAYKNTKNWTSPKDIPQVWAGIVKSIFKISF